ncbi:MAG TPA: hypothetical protein VFD57_02930, partial [Clostridia bacterium]|nr:hypothetical protein [Clostridia bacterium]
MDNKDKDLDKELGKQPELETIPSSHPPTLGETEAERKEKKRKLLKRVAVTIGIIIILLFLFRGCLGSNRDQGIDPGNGTGLEIDKNIGDIENMSKKDIVDDLNRKVAEGMLNISMNLLPVFEDGASEGNLLIINENIN